MSITPSKTFLKRIIEDCGIRLEPVAYEKLWEYHGLLRSANEDLNLTRIHNFENMVLKHYVDSLLVLQFEELQGPLVDMGSGPGLPGIPLKIARPDVEMILAEPRGARADFLQMVVDRLGLKKVEVIASKVNSRFPRKVNGVITRAVASIPETLDRVAACITPGGKMLLMKGPDCDDEIREARTSHKDLFRLVADHKYQIPGTPHDRRLVVYERLEGEAPTGDTAHAYDGEIREVTSDANPTFKLARDLLTGKGIRKQGLALISGPRVVSEVLAKFPDRVSAWLTDTKGSPPPTDNGLKLPWIRLADPLFKELDVAGTHAPLLMVQVPEPVRYEPQGDWPEGCTLFVPFQDPENVGATIRCAAAFGAARVVLLQEAAHPFHPKSARAAGPALFQVPLVQGPSIKDLPGETSVPIIALATDGPTLDSEPFPDRFGLVVGLEGPGLTDALRQGLRRRIPIAEGVESLNAATATAIALYAWKQRTSPVQSPNSAPNG